MGDAGLRQVERRWHESGAREDGEAWVRALERSGAGATVVLRARVEVEDRGYLEVARQRPRPTGQQIADWAMFSANCHSWYKHLRTGRSQPFVFFLDPAGDAWSGGGHYAAHSAEDHLRDYGHFALWCPERVDRAPRVQGTSIPPALVEAGTAHVNAMVHPHYIPGMSYTRWDETFEPYRDELMRKNRPGLLEAVSERLGRRRRPSYRTRESEVWDRHLGEERARQLKEMGEAMLRVVELVYGPEEGDAAPLPEGRWPFFRPDPRLRYL